MADVSLTRRSARELARLIRSARREPGRGARRPSRGDRSDQPEAQRDRHARRRAGAGCRARGGNGGRERRAARRPARLAGRDQGHHADRGHPHHLCVPACSRTMCRPRMPRSCAASRPPAPSCWRRPTRRNSPAAPTPTTRCSVATRNPWNPALSPAGSSGGSAVAVATGMVPLAQGTDFGCSIRIPAAFCGIVGIRPTPGLTPNTPMPLAWDPGQVHGALGRDAEDVAFMLDSMVGLSRLSPISVAPPWASALAEVERARGRQGAARCLRLRHRGHRR